MVACAFRGPARVEAPIDTQVLVSNPLWIASNLGTTGVIVMGPFNELPSDLKTNRTRSYLYTSRRHDTAYFLHKIRPAGRVLQRITSLLI